MKELINYYSLISILLIGFGFILGYNSSLKFERDYIEICIENYGDFSFNFHIFKTIILKNFTVAMLISLGGYFSAGFLTLLVLIWNGFNLGTMFTLVPYTNLSFYEFLLLFIIHGVFEITALILFSNIGLKGFLFFKNVVKNNRIQIDLRAKTFIYPSLLLFFSAIVETFLITNF
ncbi:MULTISPECIES: stage II sporulation protein M [Mesoflavibacter]|uniref:stage II sporulation protein M n=1 Tax=Mesoflavibacter TaxID=444051 RepID=UPI0026EA353B|nr:stage II sporulation protein M [Mesoflavibacter zeaxanthinifaciens]